MYDIDFDETDGLVESDGVLLVELQCDSGLLVEVGSKTEFGD
jgi:hypothetical protein